MTPSVSTSRSPKAEGPFAWLKSGLFWRTFFMLAFLIAASMAAWVASFQMVERGPRAQQIAAQVVSIVTITRSALTHSAPDSRRELLFDLASNEGIRVYPRESTDILKPPPATSLMPVIEARVRSKLGQETAFAGRVNDIPGFWVSFEIEDDQYWLMLDRERVQGVSGVQWLGWATVTLLLSLLGAVVISRLINRPLSRLNAAARAVAKGQRPEPLPESGPTEIQQTNRSFNQMVQDLNRIESDRAIILAGISHDLRTPISRMLLEVEMAKLTADARHGMQSDLAQMDSIIGQFLDYAKPVGNAHFSTFDLSSMLEGAARNAERLPNTRISTNIAKGIKLNGSPTDLQRVLNNLIENARRYGKTADSELTEVSIACHQKNNEATIEISDRGVGVPEQELEHLLRPFTRLDTARGQANGSGLGLAIVNRVARQHSGKLVLENRKGGGLTVRITLPLSGKAQGER